MDDSSTHGFREVEDEEDRWTTPFNTHHHKNESCEQVHTHLDARERGCATFFN